MQHRSVHSKSEGFGKYFYQVNSALYTACIGAVALETSLKRPKKYACSS
jgi:hypothetical protein